MGKKLTVYLVDGSEFGPRFCEIGNWVGKAVYSPRSAISTILNRSEFDNPGVYCLKGSSFDDTFTERVYIGEAENIRARLKQHLNDTQKDFNEIIFFISKDELLTKTQIKYLESRMIQLALEAKSSEIENGNSPNLPTLHEADISDMEYFLEQIKIILPLMGFKFLIPSAIIYQKVLDSSSDSAKKESYYIKTKSFSAEMVVTNQGYIILKGSEAKKDLSSSCTETYRKLRKKLIETNILSEQNGKYVFVQDAVFDSPSAASNMVLGRNSNGFTEWVDVNGLQLKDKP
jgi:hypothetical protein